MKHPFLSDFKDVLLRVFVIDQDQIPFALLFVIKKFPAIAQVLNELPVAVDVGVEMAELPKQRAFRLGIAWINSRTLE